MLVEVNIIDHFCSFALKQRILKIFFFRNKYNGTKTKVKPIFYSIHAAIVLQLFFPE